MREFIYELKVRGYELDSFAHVNHAVYLNYLEEARWQALAEGGFTPEHLRDQGWGIYLVRVEVDYLKPCFQGQLLRIHTRVEQFRNSSVTVAQEIHRAADGPDSEPAVEGQVVLVFMSSEGRPMRVPEAARRALGGET